MVAQCCWRRRSSSRARREPSRRWRAARTLYNAADYDGAIAAAVAGAHADAVGADAAALVVAARTSNAIARARLPTI